MSRLGNISIAALISAGIVAGIPFAAAEETKPKTIETGKPKPTVERPFGGPPNRDPIIAKTCATETVKCPLPQPGKTGADCTCPGEGGKVLQGRAVK